MVVGRHEVFKNPHPSFHPLQVLADAADFSFHGENLVKFPCILLQMLEEPRFFFLLVADPGFQIVILFRHVLRIGSQALQIPQLANGVEEPRVSTQGNPNLPFPVARVAGAAVQFGVCDESPRFENDLVDLFRNPIEIFDDHVHIGVIDNLPLRFTRRRHCSLVASRIAHESLAFR